MFLVCFLMLGCLRTLLSFCLVFASPVLVWCVIICSSVFCVWFVCFGLFVPPSESFPPDKKCVCLCSLHKVYSAQNLVFCPLPHTFSSLRVVSVPSRRNCLLSRTFACVFPFCHVFFSPYIFLDRPPQISHVPPGPPQVFWAALTPCLAMLPHAHHIRPPLFSVLCPLVCFSPPPLQFFCA